MIAKQKKKNYIYSFFDWPNIIILKTLISSTMTQNNIPFWVAFTAYLKQLVNKGPRQRKASIM